MWVYYMLSSYKRSYARVLLCSSFYNSTKKGFNCKQYTHVAAVALTPLTTHPHTQAELERSPVRGQEQEQPDVSMVLRLARGTFMKRTI